MMFKMLIFMKFLRLYETCLDCLFRLFEKYSGLRKIRSLIYILSVMMVELICTISFCNDRKKCENKSQRKQSMMFRCCCVIPALWMSNGTFQTAKNIRIRKSGKCFDMLKSNDLLVELIFIHLITGNYMAFICKRYCWQRKKVVLPNIYFISALVPIF